MPARRPARPHLRTPQPAPASARHIYNQYVIRVAAERRDEIRQRLTDAGIGTAIYYPGALHQQPALAAADPATQMPEAERCCAQALALPVYPGLSRDERDHVVAALLDALD